MQKSPESCRTGILLVGGMPRAFISGQSDMVYSDHGSGNIAMSLYVLMQLFSLTPEEPLAALRRQKAR
jgi:hypothetical protein